MKLLYSISLALMLGFIASCSNETVTNNETDNKTDQNKATTEVPDAQTRKAFPGRTSWKGHNIDVQQIFAGNKTIISAIDRFKRNSARGLLESSPAYTLHQAAATDMNGDEYPEILVLMTEVEGNSPILYAFSHDQKERLDPVKVQDLPDKVYENYQGGDTLFVKESSIDYRVNYIVNGSPISVTFNYSLDPDSGEMRYTEQR